MRIAYISNTRPFWSTENHVKSSLEEMGHTVVPIQEDEHSSEQVSEIVKENHADLLLWTRTWGLCGDALGMLRSLDIPSVAFHLDLYAGLERAKTVESEPWWRCSHVFTADGGSDEFWDRYRINHFYSPPAVYGREAYIADADPRLAQSVIFTGARASGYHAEWTWRGELLDWLTNAYGDKFTLYDHSSGKRGHALNVLYASAKICVGDTLCLGYTHEKYFSDRLTEVCGRGCLNLFPYIKGIEDLYEIDKEIVCYHYGDFDELKDKIDYYLSHDAERERIRLAGHLRTKREHTYRHRMQNVIDVVINGKPNKYQ